MPESNPIQSTLAANRPSRLDTSSINLAVEAVLEHYDRQRVLAIYPAGSQLYNLNYSQTNLDLIVILASSKLQLFDHSDATLSKETLQIPATPFHTGFEVDCNPYSIFKLATMLSKSSPNIITSFRVPPYYYRKSKDWLNQNTDKNTLKLISYLYSTNLAMVAPSNFIESCSKQFSATVKQYHDDPKNVLADPTWIRRFSLNLIHYILLDQLLNSEQATLDVDMQRTTLVPQLISIHQSDQLDPETTEMYLTKLMGSYNQLQKLEEGPIKEPTTAYLYLNKFMAEVAYDTAMTVS